MARPGFMSWVISMSIKIASPKHSGSGNYITKCMMTGWWSNQIWLEQWHSTPTFSSIIVMIHIILSKYLDNHFPTCKLPARYSLHGSVCNKTFAMFSPWIPKHPLHALFDEVLVEKFEVKDNTFQEIILIPLFHCQSLFRSSE